MIHATIQVVRFELTRTLTLARVAIWMGLCMFPAVLIAILRYQDPGEIPDQGYAMISYALVPQISCMLGLLLWATPVIGSELENQSWIHLVTRGKGRLGVALGKYLVAVLWTASYGVTSAVLVSLLSGVEDPMELMLALMGMVVLAALCYAALYLLIGAAFYRRATVVAVGYSLLLEGLVSLVPATINQATVSYRLRSLLADWTVVREIEFDPTTQVLFGNESSWFNVLMLLLYALLLLLVAVHVITTREYPIQTDG